MLKVEAIFEEQGYVNCPRCGSTSWLPDRFFYGKGFYEPECFFCGGKFTVKRIKAPPVGFQKKGGRKQWQKNCENLAKKDCT